MLCRAHSSYTPLSAVVSALQSSDPGASSVFTAALTLVVRGCVTGVSCLRGESPGRHQSAFHQRNFLIHGPTWRNDSGGHLYCGFMVLPLYLYPFLFAGCVPLLTDSLCTECSVRVNGYRGRGSAFSLFSSKQDCCDCPTTVQKRAAVAFLLFPAPLISW